MNNSIHKKLYKAGKLWLVATIASFGMLLATTTAHADQNQPATSQVSTTAVTQTATTHVNAAATAVTQSRQAAATNNANYGHLDGVKLTESNIAGYDSVVANGWHAADASQDEPYRYMILFDNTTNRELYRHRFDNAVTRPDVQNVYPDVNGSRESGFHDSLYVPDNVVSRGDTLSLVSRFTDDALHGEGHRTDYWFAPFKLDNANRANLDGVSIEDNQVNVSGWHATNQAAGYPYHYVIAYDVSQHRELGRQLVDFDDLDNGHIRKDVARVFPLIANAAGSGFNVSFDLRPEFINDQIQFVSRWSTSADGNSGYVDYWFGPEWLVADKSNNAYMDNFGVRNGRLHVSGWHATNLALGRNYHTIIILDANNNHELARKTVSHGQRNDVAAAFPSIMTASYSGFDASFDLQPEMFTEPLRIISRWSATPDANEDYVDYWFNGNLNLNKQAAWLDTLDEDGDTITVSGWHAADQSMIYPHHVLILFDRSLGHEIGRQEVANNYSPDVANAQGDIANAGQCRFSTTFTIDPSYANDMLQVISRYSDSASGEGNYVQIWLTNRELNTPKLALVGDYLYDRFGNAHRIPTDSPESVAHLIADVVRQAGNRTDRAKVELAALYVSEFCKRCRYTMSGPYYATPYGVFIAHEYSCAGATRALGLVLNYLGYQYHHENENQYTHQWCTLMMDGRMGWADGQAGTADYGNYNDFMNGWIDADQWPDYTNHENE